MTVWRACVLALAVAAVLALPACGGPSGSGAGAPAPSSADPAVTDLGSQPYRSDVLALTTTVLLPASAAPRAPLPIVVLVPGGGWQSADPTGLRPLAEALTGDGLAVATTTYRTSADGAFFPVPVQDVVCSVDQATSRLRASGHAPGPVVVVGHSAGAQLAALAALVGDRYQDGCGDPLVRPDGLVGLAGPYDVHRAGRLAASLFGAALDSDPASWQAGDPQLQAASRPDLPVLLVHGGADSVVPVLFSQTFADALRAAGHPVDLVVLPGRTHSDVYQPSDAEQPIRQFVESLPGAPGSSAS